MATILGIIVLIIIFLVLVLPLFIAKNYTIEKDAVIRRPITEVFNYVNLLKNQVYYNKWVMADPNMQRNTHGTDGTTGFVLAWDSKIKSVGKGEQEIIEVIPGKQITSKVRFEKPFKNTADVIMMTDATSDGNTKLVWKMKGQNAYPMNLMNLFIPGMLGKDMDESLENLKKLLENQPISKQ